MAPSGLPESLQHQDLDETFHDTYDASDSSDEFASASEGDDEQPWAPTANKTSVAARADQQVKISTQETSQVQPPIHTHTVFVTGHEHSLQQKENDEEQLEHTQPHYHSEVVVPQQQHEDQYQEVQYEHHHTHQLRQEPYQDHQQHQQAQHVSAHSHTHVDNGGSTTQTTHFYSEAQSDSHSHAYSSYTQTHSQSRNQTRQLLSTTSSPSQSTRSQHGSSPNSQRGSTPRLRERMRRSPVLHSKIVQAYLDPNAPSTQQQQQLTPDYIRQAWMQGHHDDQQESSEDDHEEVEPQLDEQRLPSYLMPVKDYGQRVVPEITPETDHPMTSSVQHQIETSYISGGETVTLQQDDQIEMSWGFDNTIHHQGHQRVDESEYCQQDEGRIIIDQAVPSEEMDSSWGFDDKLELNEPIAEPSVSLVRHTEVSHQVESSLVREALGDMEEAWGYDDQLVDIVKANVHASSVGEVTTHQDESSHIREALGDMEEAWGHDDQLVDIVMANVHGSSVSEVTAHQDESSHIREALGDMEEAWGHDDQLVDIVTANVHGSSAGGIATHQDEISLENEEDAWGHDDQLADLVKTDIHDLSAGETGSGMDIVHDSTSNTHFDEVDYREKTMSSCSNPFASPEDAQADRNLSSTVSTTLEQSHTESTVEISVPIETFESHHHSNRISTHSETHTSLRPLQDQINVISTHSVHETQVQPTVHEHRGLAVAETFSAVEDVDSAGAEASWGSDMGDAIDIETQVVDQKGYIPHHGHNEQANVVQQQEHRKSVIIQDSSHSTEDRTVHQGSFTETSIRTTEHERRMNQESDNEHDTEVREVLHATQSNPLDNQDHGHQSGTVSSVLSSNTSEQKRTSLHISSVDYTESSAVSLQIKPDTLPEFIEADKLESPVDEPDSTSISNDLRGVGSDSEGSDTYGYLSTARTFTLGSSNRLNEILEDDDFLEHMERGVPLDRSISTPFSDDESPPKFIVDDDVVESMERGEPWSAGGASTDSEDAPLDNGEGSASMEFEAELGQDTSSVLNAPRPVIPLSTIATTGVLLHETSTTHATESHTIVAESTRDIVSTSEQVEECKDSHHVDFVSDDKDPANPFSDAAAIDDQDAWPVSDIPTERHAGSDNGHVELAQEHTESLESNTMDVVQSTTTTSVESVQKFEGITEGDLEEDAWADQDLNIVVEPTHARPYELMEETKIETSVDNHVRTTVQETSHHVQTTVEETTHHVQPTVQETTHHIQHADASADIEGGVLSRGELDTNEDQNGISNRDTGNEAAIVPESLESHSTKSIEVDLEKDIDLIIDDDAWAERDDEVLADISHKHDTQSDIAIVENDHQVQEAHLVTEAKDAMSSIEMEAEYSQSTSSQQEFTSSERIEVTSGLELITDTESTKARQRDVLAGLEDHFSMELKPEPSSAGAQEYLASDNDRDAQHHAMHSVAVSTSSETIAHAHVKDDALDAALEQLDAWDDQDLDIEVESSSFSVKQDVQQIDTPTSHHTLKTEPYQSLENVVDAALDEDAWGADNDLDGLDLELAKPEHLDTLSRTENIIVSHADHQTLASSTTAAVVTESNDDDAWAKQDNNILPIKQEFEATLTTGGLNEHVDVRSSVQLAGDVDTSALDAALEEDMWLDQDLDLTSTAADVANTLETHQTSTFKAHETAMTHVSTGVRTEFVKESNYSTVVTSTSHESVSQPIPDEPKIDFNLDDALEEDAWGAQDDVVFSNEQPSSGTGTLESASKKDESVHQVSSASQVEQYPAPSSHKSGSFAMETSTEQIDVPNDDGWAWDDDEVDIDLKVQAETVVPKEQNVIHKETRVVSTQETTTHTLLPAVVTTRTSDRPSSLSIDHGHRTPGRDSGEGDDSANQSPWQDVSPASASKRSDAGMSVGSEFELESSVRSLDDFERVSPILGHGQLHGRDRSSGSASSGSRGGLGDSLSWTDIKHEEWNVESHENVRVGSHKEDTSAAIQDLPDLSGADNWEFDQDDGLLSDGSTSFADQTPPVSARSPLSKNLRTPDMSENRSSFLRGSSAGETTPSPGRRLSYQSSTAGSVPPSPSSYQTQHAAPVSSSSTSGSLALPSMTTEVEDDSHLPAAIRQQRARLAARGKPLPPISKYKSTKGTSSAEKISTAISPQLSGTISPAISLTSPIKSPISPLSNTALIPAMADQKYLTPALQKQKERLEQKRAAAAASAPRSTARRLTATESSLDRTLSTSQDRVLTSPQLSHATVTSGLMHTSLMSPTLGKKTLHQSESTEISTSSILAPSAVEDFGFTSRRRGSSTTIHSQQQHQGATTVPTSPLSEGFVRRSRDGARPKMAHAEETRETDVMRASQTDSYRHVSRLSTSSSRSGWEEITDREEEGGRDVQEIGLGLRKGSISKEHTAAKTLGLSSSSSSSFYQQTVPGLDDVDDDNGRDKTSSGFKSSTTASTFEATSSTSSYLSNKKADDYDPYGPLASRSKGKVRDSMDDDSGSTSFMEHQETLIGRSTSSPSVSYMSSSGTSISHRHEHHQPPPSLQSSSSGGFFGGGSLVGDISDMMSDKKTDADRDTRRPSMSQSSSSNNLPKSGSSSWSFGSWVTSAVAAATDVVDKAYESLDPEYSKMKTRGSISASSDHGLSESGMDDPDSTSPFKRPGYVVGGSSLALGLASIATNPASPTSQSMPPQQLQPSPQQQQQEHSASPRTRRQVSGR
ncbi:hypothetical protein BGX31_010900 [Mortierella sp. GBA43]|nr:hypothetical protein BGX31_010900 [Mortierella sp. GBA43]